MPMFAIRMLMYKSQNNIEIKLKEDLQLGTKIIVIN